ncbi:MAG: AAA family ATPase, partial [Nitrospirae bacterium]|nr:AAA family ATPase [Nitrospirota bacterium]
MLKELRIKNLAIIDDLTVRFERGLNILTGETGAGKSIIVDALGLALGDRAQSDLIKSGEKEATVQAYFELEDPGSFPDIGVDTAEGIFLRRVLSSGGKSRAYINDTMVTLQTLAEAGKTLVDILSQHEHQSLLTPEKQRMLLDSYGKLQPHTEEVSSLFHEIQTLSAECTELRERVRERAHRLDLLRFQISEIDEAALQPGEKEVLEEEKKILSNMNRLNELTETAYVLLYDAEGSCTEKLSKAIGKIREMAAIDSSVEETLKMLESALPLVEDASAGVRGYRDRYDFEPGRLDAVEERLELIRKLIKKYGADIEAVLRYRDEAEKELTALESTDERLASSEKALEEKEEEL